MPLHCVHRHHPRLQPSLGSSQHQHKSTGSWSNKQNVIYFFKVWAWIKNPFLFKIPDKRARDNACHCFQCLCLSPRRVILMLVTNLTSTKGCNLAWTLQDMLMTVTIVTSSLHITDIQIKFTSTRSLKPAAPVMKLNEQLDATCR